MLALVVSSLPSIRLGLSLGTRIREVSGFEYDVFIVPGLIAMAMAQAAYSNNLTGSSRHAATATSTTCSPLRCARGR